MQHIQQWWSRWQRQWWSLANSQRWVLVIVLLATILGATFRLYNLRHSIQFLADQGRDAIVASEILHGHVALVGPSTSVGSMFLGPAYYYFMAPWLALGGMDPFAPALAIAVMGILTIPLLYYVGKLYVGRAPALIATLLYASAPTVIEYTRFSWNPNPAPFVMLMMLWCLYKVWHGRAWWWVGVSASIAILMQLHYVALLAAFPAGLVWLADIWRTWRPHSNMASTSRRRDFMLAMIVAILVMLASWMPLVIFDIRYHGIIRKGFGEFFQSSGQLKPAGNSLSSLNRIWREQQGRALQLLFEIWGKEWSVGNMNYRHFNIFLLGTYGLTLLAGSWFWWRSKFRWGTMIILLTLLGSAFGLSFYRSTVFSHYIAFFFPISYLITGLVIWLWWRSLKWLGLAAGLALMAYIGWMSVQPTQLRYLTSLGWTIDDYSRVSKLILSQIPPNKTYTLAQLSEIRDYRGLSYRYFLLNSSRPPVDFAQAGVADELVIVAENPVEPEAVLNSPVYEISSFPRGEYRQVIVPGGPHLYFVQRLP
jgi:4-amino-4-deoxy-L-arabinose transferase-like glycosyltransferase